MGDRHPTHHVHIHCCLSSVALSQLSRAFPPPNRITSSSDWNVVLSRLRDRSCDAVIVDPDVAGERPAAERLSALAATGVAPVPILGYVSVTASAIKAAHTLARLGASEIIVRGFDDSPAALVATVHRAVTEHAATRLVRSSTSLFASLPATVADAVVALFRRPERTKSVDELAANAGTTRRSLDRHLARAGLAPARTLLACARANAAYHLLAGGGMRSASAASLVGYASSRALAREFRAVTGHAPSAVPARLPPELFVATVNRRLTRTTDPG